MATVAAGLILLLSGLVMVGTHRPGHYWGDDYALYIRQAEAIAGPLSVAQVVADNEFTLTNSQDPDFSPPVYPWGWPLLLAGPVAVVGSNVDALSGVSVATALVFLGAWYFFARRRLGAGLSLLGVSILALSPVYVRWTDWLHSELPFMALTFIALCWFDRLRPGWVKGVRPGALAGLMAAMAFSVRREGMALLVAIAVGQVVDLVQRGAPWRRGHTWLVLAAPWATFGVSVGLLQTILPSTLIPRYPGTSLLNGARFAAVYLTDFSRVFGAESARVGGLVAGVALVGMVYRLGTRWPRDLKLAAFLVVAYILGGSFFVPSGRYMATVVPLMWYFALWVPVGMWEQFPRRWARRSTALVTALVLAITLSTELPTLASYRSGATSGEVWPGPQEPDARQMFARVEALTSTDDVVGFFKARAMTLETGRLSVQVGQDRSPFEARIFLDLVVLETDSPWVGEMLHSPRYRLIWSNASFLLFIPARVEATGSRHHVSTLSS